MACQPSALGASAGRGPGSRAPSRKRLGRPASIPRAVMSGSPEALAFGSRRHFIPASLSLPLCGCLLYRSRDCSRSRVPPRLPRRRYADAPAAASFSRLRFASARFHLSPVGGRNWKLDPTRRYHHSAAAHWVLGPYGFLDEFRRFKAHK